MCVVNYLACVAFCAPSAQSSLPTDVDSLYKVSCAISFLYVFLYLTITYDTIRKHLTFLTWLVKFFYLSLHLNIMIPFLKCLIK